MIVQAAPVRSLFLSFVPGLFLALAFLCAPVQAQEEPSPSHVPPLPKPWQIAGIRAAVGDSRAPVAESSSAVRREALELCIVYRWGSVLDPREMAVHLGSGDDPMRVAAIEALGQMGKKGQSTAKQLVAIVRESGPGNRPMGTSPYFHLPLETASYVALVALGEMAVDGAPVAGDIAELLSDRDLKVRFRDYDGFRLLREAGLKMAAFAKEVPAQLRDGDADVRYDAYCTLACLGKEAVVFAPEATALLKDPDPRKRGGGVFALGLMGEEAAAFALDVAVLLKDPDSVVRHAAVCTLGHMGRGAAPFARDVAAVLKDDNPLLCKDALDALEAMSPEGSSLASQVAALLNNTDPRLRVGAARNLCKMGKAGAVYARETVALLKDREYYVRTAVVGCLSFTTEQATYAREIAALLESEDRNAREASVEALGKMGVNAGDFAVKVAALLKDPDRHVRSRAVSALGLMGHAGEVFAPQVAAFLKDADSDLRRNAAEALGQMGDAGAAYAEEMVSLLKDPDDTAGAAAASALIRMKSKAVPTARKIADLLSDTNIFRRHFAMKALLQMGQDGLEVAKDVASLLGDHSESLREEAVAYFMRCGNPAGDLDLQAALLSAVDMAPAGDVPKLRAYLRLWAGDNEVMQRTVTWLGKPDWGPMPKEGLSADETRKTLAVFSALWDHTASYPTLRKELAGRIEQVSKSITWKPDADTAKILDDLAAKRKDQL